MNDGDYAAKYLAKIRSTTDRGIEFTLTFNEYKRLLKIKRCFYTRDTLTFHPGLPNSFSLDRIDASKGYIKGNVVACTSDMNRKKRDLTINDIKIIHNRLVKKGLV